LSSVVAAASQQPCHFSIIWLADDDQTEEVPDSLQTYVDSKYRDVLN
jgi:hypothetical protein